MSDPASKSNMPDTMEETDATPVTPVRRSPDMAAVVETMASLLAAPDDNASALRTDLEAMFSSWKVTRWEDLMAVKDTDVEDYIADKKPEQLSPLIIERRLGYLVRYAKLDKPLTSALTMASVIREVDKQQQPSTLYNLVFRAIQSGSSGVPHILEDLEEFPMAELKLLQVQEYTKPLYRRLHLPRRKGEIHYSRENQVQAHLETLVTDVIESCNYGLTTDTEAALNGLKVDIGFLRDDNDDLCGTMEVKQPYRRYAQPPDPDPMTHPKVVTQVLSQMIPLRTMYGVKNVYGILSTYSSWRFFRWLPSEEYEIRADESLEESEITKKLENLGMSDNKIEEGSSVVEASQYRTPRKARSGTLGPRNSPPTSPKPYCDCDQTEQDGDEDQESDGDTTTKRGILYASEVISDAPKALRVLAWVLGEMYRSPRQYVPSHQRDFLYVVKKGEDDMVGGYERVPHDAEFYKGRMPRVDVEKLYILEELGHRSHGRVFRAMSKGGNLCVIKYFVKSQYALNENGKRVQFDARAAAQKSVSYWNAVYAHNWLPAARFGTWGGGDAILMPDLEKIPVMEAEERLFVMNKLEETMKERFHRRGIWHDDPAWRNVALVRNQLGRITKVCMIDLEPARMIEKVESDKWGEFETMWGEFQKVLDADWDNFKATLLTGSSH